MPKFPALIAIFLVCSSVSFSQGMISLEKFEPGHYYDSAGNKVTGLLKFKYGGSAFSSKKDGDCELLFRAEKGEKRQKFNTREIRSFVIGNDSFAIVKNFDLNAFVYYPQDFAKVIESGKINLYLYYATVNSGGQFPRTSTVTYYLVEKDGKVVTIKKGILKETLNAFFYSDYPDLADKYGKKIRISDLPLLTKMYNERFSNVAASK